MDAFKTKNYCIDKSVLKTCRRGGVSIKEQGPLPHHIARTLTARRICLGHSISLISPPPVKPEGTIGLHSVCLSVRHTSFL